ncbi:hypothetical protein [Rufibacter quisquiliarum]|uniref:Uncharacterized protein YcfL n=1 Tax=Rufibacter quisquiliarum TaxID=1549639 RepID=A0A839GX06_9BACT|nr:hypothetical protein [Rufibacter quisquiliarum]MBA9078958.1 uncharacterized protein YcfL [Rufibacter quisquiliarum]
MKKYLFISLILLALYSCDGKQAIIEKTARERVAERLKSPDTADFISAEIVGGTMDTAYVVHVVVDAQNDFGAKKRSSYLVALKQDGERLYWDQEKAVQEAGVKPTKQEIALMAQINDFQ